MDATPARESVRVAITRLSGELTVMYAQGGFSSVLIGVILGIAIHHLRLSRFSLPGMFRA